MREYEDTPRDIERTLGIRTARWSTMIHAQNYDYATFAKEVDHIGKHLSKTYKK